MCLGVRNRLSNPYQGKVLDSRNKKDNAELATIKDSKSVDDNVLDLSDKDILRSEIQIKDISHVRAIKINGQLIKINQSDLKNLVNELKEKCLNPDNSLKDNFKFAYFEKETGISAFETELEVSDIKAIYDINNDVESLISDISKKQNLFNTHAQWVNGGPSLKVMHENKSKELAFLKNNTQITESNIDQLISKLEAKYPDSQELKDLKAQKNVLSVTNELVTTFKEYNDLMLEGGVQDPTKEFLDKADLLKNKLDEKITVLEFAFGREKDNILSADFKNNIKKTIEQSKNSLELMDNTIKLCDSEAFIRIQKDMGKHIQFSSVTDQYSHYLATFKPGQTERPRKGETKDIQGFIHMRNNHHKDDSILAKKLDDLSARVMSNEFGPPKYATYEDSKKAVHNEIDKLFKGTGIAQKNIDAVTQRFDRLLYFKLKDDRLGLQNARIVLNQTIDNSVIRDIRVSENEINKLDKTRLNDYGAFGNSSETELKKVHEKTIQIREKVERDLPVINQNLTNRLERDFNNIQQNPNALVDFLEHDLGDGSRANINIGVQLSAEANAVIIGGEAKLEARVGLTVEKKFDANSRYSVSVDLGASMGLEVKVLFGLLEGEAKAALTSSLGVGFRNADEVRQLATMIESFITEAKSEDASFEDLNFIANDISLFVMKRLELRAGASLSAKVESDKLGIDYNGKDQSSAGIKLDGSSSSTREVSINGEGIKYKKGDGEEDEFKVQISNQSSSRLDIDSKTLKRTSVVISPDHHELYSMLKGESKVSDQMIRDIAKSLISEEANDLGKTLAENNITQVQLESYLRTFFEDAQYSSAFAKIEPIFDLKSATDMYDDAKKSYEYYLGKPAEYFAPDKTEDFLKKNPKLNALKTVMDNLSLGTEIGINIEVVDNMDSNQKELKIGFKVSTSAEVKANIREVGGDLDYLGVKAKAGVNAIGSYSIDGNLPVSTYRLSDLD